MPFRPPSACPPRDAELRRLSSSPEMQTNQDAEHLRLLSIFYYVVAGLTALFACFPIIHVVIGWSMMQDPGSFAGPGQGGPDTAWVGRLFAVMGGAFVLGGWALAVAQALTGRFLRKRERYTFCLVVAGISTMFVPFGTVLGVFTIIVLMRPSVQALFGRAPSPGGEVAG